MDLSRYLDTQEYVTWSKVVPVRWDISLHGWLEPELQDKPLTGLDLRQDKKLTIVSSLPATLTKIDISGLPIVDCSPLARLNLLDLNVSGISSLKASDVPKSVTCLIARNSGGEDGINFLSHHSQFSNIRELDVMGTTMEDSTALSFPKTLTTLRMNTPGLTTQLLQLPLLTTLECANFQLYTKIPPSVTDLTIDSNAVVDQLPVNLLHLTCRTTWIDKLSLRCKSLQSLLLTGRGYQGDYTYQDWKIFPHLTTLAFKDPYRYEDVEFLVDQRDGDAILGLPPTLTKLDITTSYNCSLNLSSVPKLQSLKLIGFNEVSNSWTPVYFDNVSGVQLVSLHLGTLGEHNFSPWIDDSGHDGTKTSLIAIPSLTSFKVDDISPEMPPLDFSIYSSLTELEYHGEINAVPQKVQTLFNNAPGRYQLPHTLVNFQGQKQLKYFAQLYSLLELELDLNTDWNLLNWPELLRDLDNLNPRIQKVKILSQHKKVSSEVEKKLDAWVAKRQRYLVELLIVSVHPDSRGELLYLSS